MEPAPLRFEVRSFEADPSGRLTLPALCAFLQEAARVDAAAMGAGTDLLARHGLAWMLLRLDLRIAADARIGETLDVTTWATRWERIVAGRDFDVRAPGGAGVAAGTSSWMVVDLATRRLVRLPAFIRSLPLPARAPAMGIDAEDPPATGKGRLERRLEVRRSDLDAARHVNCTRYVEWALEALPDTWLDTHRAARFQVRFRRESVYGDAVLSRAGRLERSDGALRFAHLLVREADGEELARALSEWEPPRG